MDLTRGMGGTRTLSLILQRPWGTSDAGVSLLPSLNPLKMAGPQWSDEEKCLAIWFASIGVPHAIITLLLQERGFSPTMTGV